jgi:lipoate-protein ligase A
VANSCVILPYSRAEGAANMALDEALLDAVAADPARAYFRLYGWTVPTLSLGYFQRLSEADADPRWRGVPTVRRPTGGGALWHDRELTYALVLPRAHPLAADPRALYRRVHDAFAALLRAAGIDAARRGGSAASDAARPFLCFSGHDADDVVARGTKLVGSAQRRRAGAVLQHGSLLLDRSAATPVLAGANDLAARPRDEAFWHDRLAAELPAALDLEPEHAPPGGDLLTRAAALEAGVYRNPQWLRRR